MFYFISCESSIFMVYLRYSCYSGSGAGLDMNLFSHYLWQGLVLSMIKTFEIKRCGFSLNNMLKEKLGLMSSEMSIVSSPAPKPKTYDTSLKSYKSYSPLRTLTVNWTTKEKEMNLLLLAIWPDVHESADMTSQTQVFSKNVSAEWVKPVYHSVQNEKKKKAAMLSKAKTTTVKLHFPSALGASVSARTSSLVPLPLQKHKYISDTIDTWLHINLNSDL